MRFYLLLGVLLGCAAPVAAQPTNAALYERLGLGCLADVPGTLDALRLDAPEAMPYLRTALVQHWQEAGYRVYAGTDTTAALPRLHYEVERAEVTYARAGRGRLERTVTLALRYDLTAPDGQVLVADACTDAFSDPLAAEARLRVEDPAYPETQGAVPEGGLWRRYLEPALLTAATAIGVYLFFALRSDRADT